jgi:hypothetical protein
MGLGYLEGPHRGRKIGPRAHAIPNLEQIILQIGLKLVQSHFIHSWGTLVGSNPPHTPL